MHVSAALFKGSSVLSRRGTLGAADAAESGQGDSSMRVMGMSRDGGREQKSRLQIAAAAVSCAGVHGGPEWHESK